MTPEIAKMTRTELQEWEAARRAEAADALSKGNITLAVHDSIQEWITDTCFDWMVAQAEGLTGRML